MHRVYVLALAVASLITLLLVPVEASAFVTTEPPDNLAWRSGIISDSVYEVAWSPDGNLLAVAGRFGELLVYDSRGSLVWQRPLGSMTEGGLSWSPDGSMVAVGVGYSVVVLDRNGKFLWEKEHRYWVESVAWSPSGDKLAVGGQFRGVVVYTKAGTQLWKKDLGAWVWSVAWSPDGDKLAVATGWSGSANSYSDRILVYDVRGNLLWSSSNLSEDVYSVSWSPDGKMLAAGTRSRIIVYNSTGELLWRVDVGNDVQAVAWSPRGDMIAVGGELRYVLVYNANGTLLWRSPDLSGMGEGVWSVAWSPDGTRLAVGTGDPVYVGREHPVYRVLVYDFSNTSFLLIKAPKCCGVNATISDNSSTVRIQLGRGENGIVYVQGVPGTLYLALESLGSKPVIGPPIQLETGRVETLELNLQHIHDSLATITLTNHNTTTANTTITWPGGTTSLTLPPGGQKEYYAVPGNYTITLTLHMPDNIIGDTSNLTLTQTQTITLDQGEDREISVPGLENFLPQLRLVNKGDTTLQITIAWNNGYTTKQLNPMEEATLWAAKGTYSIITSRTGPLARLYKENYQSIHIDRTGTLTVSIAPPPPSPLFYLVIAATALSVYFSMLHPWVRIIAVVTPDRGLVIGRNNTITIIIRKYGLLPTTKTLQTKVADQTITKKIKLKKTGEHKITLNINLQQQKNKPHHK